MPTLVAPNGRGYHIKRQLYSDAGYVPHPLQVLPKEAYNRAGGIAQQTPPPAKAYQTWLHPTLQSQVAPITINHRPKW
jgi:hypothetical protein